VITVVKLGGSLNEDALLPAWLSLLAEHGGGRAVLVPGGGRYADQVRRAQAHWGFDDLAAHNMAVLAMAQSAYQWAALAPHLVLAETDDALERALAKGHTPLWLPLDRRRTRPDARTHWDASADTLAFDLALRLRATRLVLVKSCEIPPTASLTELCASGVIDRSLAALARDAELPVAVLPRTGLGKMRALLDAGA